MNLALVLVLVLSAMALSSSAGAAPPPDVVPGQYIITFSDNVADPGAKAEALAHKHGLGVLYTYRHALKGFAATVPAARLAQLQADPDVVSITPDHVVNALKKPTPTPVPTPPPSSSQTLPTGINRIEADLSSTARINGTDERVDVDVAVIDTGIDLDHPDLNVYVAGGYNCTKFSTFDDGNGHGTHVAGTIGALDNNVGVVGVAPGARLWPVRVLDNRGSGTWSSIICGVEYVTTNADSIEVANMSLGGVGSDPPGTGCDTGDPLHDAICNSVLAGVTYVVAAGNEADDAANHVPAAYDEVISVSALADFDGQPGSAAAATCLTDVDDTFAYFSNYGDDVDLIAPGVCIYSTYKGGGYATMSGTSMASPHVAGAAALYLFAHPGASPAQVKDALQTAGTSDWTGDTDGTQEPLVNVGRF